MRKTLVLLITALFITMSLAMGADVVKFEGKNKTPFAVPKTAVKITLDGDVTDAEWGNALVFDLAYETNPGDNTEPQAQTLVYLMYDENNLYIAFVARDPDISQMRANLSDRDHAWNDDWVGVLLDTYNDERRSLNFVLNPAGVQMDEIETPNGTDGSWDAIWDSETRIFDWGFGAEMIIPFSALKFQKTDGPQIWGFDAIRYYPRNRDYRMQVIPKERGNNCYFCQMVKIQGFEGVRPGRNIEIKPTLTALRTDVRNNFPYGDMEEQNSDADAGVTASWGITNNVTISATANPDFSQVEADSAQLDINQPFALYFDEKRPFFTESSDFFQMRWNVVHTRSFRDPQWGLKLTGKEGDHTFGAYLVRDDITNILFPGNTYSRSTTLYSESTAAVLRYKYDIGTKHTVGVTFTDREGDDYYNRVGMFDGIFRLTGNDKIQVHIIGTSTQYPEDLARRYNQPIDEFGGYFYEFCYDRTARNYSLYAGFREIDDGLRADVGFMSRVGCRTFYINGNRKYFGEGDSFYDRLIFTAGYKQITDQENVLIWRETFADVQVDGPMRSFFWLKLSTGAEAIAGMEYDQTCANTYFSISPTRFITFDLDGFYGDELDYSNGRQGSELTLAPAITLNISSNLRASISHTFDSMDVDSQKLYRANITQSTVVYHFNTRALFRAILQYVNYDRNVENYTFPIDQKYEHLFSQLLFSYKINPYTVLYLGYTDNYEGSNQYDLTRTDQTFFVKVGYAWQL